MKKILLTLTLVASAIVSYGQGTIQFQNGTLTRFQLFDDGTSAQASIPVGTQLNFGVFVGTAASSISLTPVTPLAQIGTSAGVLNLGTAGNNYQVTGNGGDTVFLMIRGWSSSFGSDWAAAKAAYDLGIAGTMYGEAGNNSGTAPISFVLGPSSGPGTVIWSGSDTTGTKFRPLVVHVAVPEPSTIALGVLGMAGLVFIRRRK